MSEFRPIRLILLDHSESSIYNIDMEIRQKVSLAIEIVPTFAGVQGQMRIIDIVSEYKPVAM